MAHPRISVVTPSYNQAPFLEKTIQSVLTQKTPEIEYFVIDGGSTDGSIDIIRKYESEIDHWVSEKDRGQADGINKGFSLAGGEIFGWINSDDFYLKGAFEKVLAYFDAHPEVDLVYGDVLSVNQEGELINVMRFADYALRDLMAFRIISQPAVFFRRKAWYGAGGMDLRYHFLLDHHLWLRIAAGGKIAYLPEPLAAARFYPEAKNRAHAADFGVEAYRIADWLLTDPEMKPYSKGYRRVIQGGADWLNANYLSNGNHPWKSLKNYAKAFAKYPSRVIEDRRRVGVTLLMAISPEKATDVFRREAQKRMDAFSTYRDLL